MIWGLICLLLFPILFLAAFIALAALWVAAGPWAAFLVVFLALIEIICAQKPPPAASGPSVG